jgi:protein phosphatase
MEVARLVDEATEIFKSEDMCLRLRAPIKVYGDIHGQYQDLMRLFARYKAPSDGDDGDIDSTDYLFLGDYVDRGSFSLETVCLLFALKCRYPQQIHLIRGNHEDPTINSIYGFRDECQRKLREDSEEPDSCWNRFNRAFEWMPVGAVIEDRILCLHGGIGGAINSVQEINDLRRPLHVAQIPQTPLEQRVTDLLWSDPSDSDAITGVTLNETRDPDGTGRIVKYGPDRVQDFLEANAPLSMILRAHECVMDGFERFANGHLITVFSATDYCGHHKNAGALLFVRRDLTIVPKLIYPTDRTMSTWDPMVMQQRPPTPPRPVHSSRTGEVGEW